MTIRLRLAVKEWRRAIEDNDDTKAAFSWTEVLEAFCEATREINDRDTVMAYKQSVPKHVEFILRMAGSFECGSCGDELSSGEDGECDGCRCETRTIESGDEITLNPGDRVILPPGASFREQ